MAVQKPLVIVGGQIQQIPAGDTLSTGGGGGSSVTTSDTAPASPIDGDLWWDSATGVLMVYYDDGTSAQWVEAMVSNPSFGATPSDVFAFAAAMG